MARKRKELPELHNIEITGVAAEGKALARVKLRETDVSPIVVFVPYAAPGDKVDLKVDKKKHNYAEAHILRITEPSSLRREPACSYFGTCGGCKWQHLPYEEQLKYKRQQVVDALERIAKVELPVIPDTLPSRKEWGYRNKMEYTFSDRKWRSWDDIRSGKEFSDSPNALGFHIPGAFDKVLHIEKCHLQSELGDEIRNFIYKFADENCYSFYNIKENHGLLRTLMIRISSTGQVMVCLTFGEEDPEKIKEILTAVKERFPEITSLLYVVNLKLNDSIADQDVITFSGPDYIEEEMEGLKFRVNAKSFYQTNSLQAYELYKVAREFAGLSPQECKEESQINSEDTERESNIEKSEKREEKPLVYDLYTGTGTIANFIARQARKVVGIEYVEEAIADARLNSEVNGLDNTLFYAGDMKDILTDEFIKRHGRPDIMIVDPPRAGMHEDVVKVILNAGPDVIVYVSCNPATQARDIAMLDTKYKVTSVQPVDMFPHTHHVENVVKLEKR